MPLPTVGRIVWYFPNREVDDIITNNYQPLAAIVAAVFDEGKHVNLRVFDADGEGHPRRAIVFVQADEVAPGTGPRAARSYACWMPYQVGQAAKTEQLQADLDAKFPKRAGE